jgi:hypothetical protein
MEPKITTGKAMKKHIDMIDSESKLIKTLKMEGISDLLQNSVELGIDSLLGEGLAKDIPIVSTIVSFAKVAYSIRDKLYLRKLLLFLQKVADTSKLEQGKFIEENCKDAQRFEQAVLLLLELADHMEKATLIGKVFKACVLGQFTYEDAITLSTMINKALWQDIAEMLKGNYTYESKMRLCSCGLLTLDWTKKIEQNLAQGQIQKVAFDGFRFKDNQHTKMLKVVAKL